MDKKSKIHLKNLDQKLTLLLRDLKTYTDAKLNEQPSDSEWSVLQIMQHLMKAEAGSVSYVQKKLSYEPELANANVLSSFRSVYLNMALTSPFKIKAPAQISGDALSTNLTFWEVAKQWKGQRNELNTYLESLPEDYFIKDLYKHPLSGKMTLSSMLSFFNKHVDRHTRQIKRTLKKIDAVKQI
ncbi:MAG: DinB family protein [Saprospiraceae bacterium]